MSTSIEKVHTKFIIDMPCTAISESIDVPAWRYFCENSIFCSFKNQLIKLYVIYLILTPFTNTYIQKVLQTYIHTQCELNIPFRISQNMWTISYSIIFTQRPNAHYNLLVTNVCFTRAYIGLLICECVSWGPNYALYTVLLHVLHFTMFLITFQKLLRKYKSYMII